MADLTVEKIIEMHDILIDGFGGTQGILDEGTLEYLVYCVNREKDPIRKAALVLFYIASKHPFIDVTNERHSLRRKTFSGYLGNLGCILMTMRTRLSGSCLRWPIIKSISMV